MIHGWHTFEIDIVETLTRRLRLMALDHLSPIWWPDGVSRRAVRRGLRRLCQANLIQRTFLNAHPRLKARRPLVSWKPGEPEPNARLIARRASDRWTESSRPTEVYWATRVAANLFGSDAGRLPDLTHRNHDLLLADVYVTYRQRSPQLAVCWIGEDCLPKAGYRIKDPDAFLVSEDGKPFRVIESAGRYGIRQINSFHEHCCDRELPYELW